MLDIERDSMSKGQMCIEKKQCNAGNKKEDIKNV